MRTLKHTVTSNVIPLLAYILLHLPQQISVTHTDVLQQRRQIVRRVCAVRTAVALACAGQSFR